MTGITFQRDQIFKGWTEAESSKVVGVVGEEYTQHEEEPRITTLRKWIAQYHTNEAQERYFYSVRKVCPLDIAKESQRIKKILYFVLTILICIGISIIVFLKTNPYFENAWKICQEIADKKEYVIKKIGQLYGFERYATAEDIWHRHPAGASLSLFFRNAFCFLFPFGGLSAWAALNKETNERRYYNLIIDRSKDERICPANFDIQNEVDPLTQEEITIEKLHSPQMIYLSNYVTEAKSFVTVLLIAGKKDFSDPVYRSELTPQQRKAILSQIEKIFLISEEKFNRCFEAGNTWELFLDYADPGRFRTDPRVSNETGQFSTEAARSVQTVIGDDTASLPSSVNARIEILQATGYINSLRKDDKAHSRIQAFERLTGISLVSQ